MKIKYLARKLGRKIKKETSIPHVVAMRMGKMLAQGNDHLMTEKFPDNCRYHTSCSCCGPILYLGFKDKKGEFHLQYRP